MPSWFTSEAALDIRSAVDRADDQFKIRIRMWKARKALSWAKRGLHRARVHLTQHRHDAIETRDKIAQAMFGGGRSITDVALAVLQQVRQETADQERVLWAARRDYFLEMRRQWFVQRRDWAGDIQGAGSLQAVPQVDGV